jgi:hypothetical protein
LLELDGEPIEVRKATLASILRKIHIAPCAGCADYDSAEALVDREGSCRLS